MLLMGFLSSTQDDCNTTGDTHPRYGANYKQNLPVEAKDFSFYMLSALRAASAEIGRNNQISSSRNSPPPTASFNATGAADGEKNPSRQPAITSIGITPETSLTA
jgi:hypothetical protein